jgi:nitrate/nitrite-specific signal transduction histidine kinase
LAIQSITQYSLQKQAGTALPINIAGKQRLLSQRVLTNFYECRLLKCNYADIELDLERLYVTNLALQEIDSRLKPLEDVEIQKNFGKLNTDINYIYSSLNNSNSLETVSFESLSGTVGRFISVMDASVLQFQKRSEDDIRTLMIVELGLVALSILIIILEIILIINPAINKISFQNKKLKEISWHQSHAFNSHIKNIKDLQHVLKIEKNMAHKQELIDCVMYELDNLEQVSKNMTNSLESHKD